MHSACIGECRRKMRHHKSNSGTEHIIQTTDGPAGSTLTYCGRTVYGSAEIEDAETASRVADNLCETCRKAMADEEMALYELADEVSAMV